MGIFLPDVGSDEDHDKDDDNGVGSDEDYDEDYDEDSGIYTRKKMPRAYRARAKV